MLGWSVRPHGIPTVLSTEKWGNQKEMRPGWGK